MMESIPTLETARECLLGDEGPAMEPPATLLPALDPLPLDLVCPLARGDKIVDSRRLPAIEPLVPLRTLLLSRESGISEPDREWLIRPDPPPPPAIVWIKAVEARLPI